MDWAGYLATAGVALAELFELRSGPRFVLTACLLGAFAVMLVILFHKKVMRRNGWLVAGAAVASGIVVAVMAVGATPIFGAILFFIICTIIGMRMPPWVAIAWVTGAAASLLLCLLARRDGDWLPTMASFSVGFFAFTAFSIAFRRSQQSRAESQQLLAELTSAQGRLRDMAVMEERQRLAREMHDAVGHRLTAAAVLLEGAGRLISTEPERATRMVETSRVQVRQGLDELRAAVSALHAEPVAAQPLAEVLAALVDVFSQGAEARVTLEVAPGIPEPDQDRKLVVVRTAQEALTNVQKHAAATRVEMALRMEDGAWVLDCRDNGRGPGEPGVADRSGFGLGNLGARAAAFGGRVDLRPGPGGGSLLRLTLPASAEGRDA